MTESVKRLSSHIFSIGDCISEPGGTDLYPLIASRPFRKKGFGSIIAKERATPATRESRRLGQTASDASFDISRSSAK